MATNHRQFRSRFLNRVRSHTPASQPEPGGSVPLPPGWLACYPWEGLHAGPEVHFDMVHKYDEETDGIPMTIEHVE